MDNLKQQINNEKILLNYINKQKQIIENNIIKLQTELYKICLHNNVKRIPNYYDRSTTLCLDCGYEY